MNHNEIEQAIDARWRADLTPALVVLAKGYLTRNVGETTAQMVDGFAVALEAHTPPQPVLIHPSIPPENVIQQVAKWLACRIAACEAIWSLIGTGALIPMSSGTWAPDMHVGWTTVIPGSGGESSGWRFRDAVPVPDRVRLATMLPTHLTDGDLYLANLDLPDLDPQITASLHEAVSCFRHDLYVPAQVMLGRAFEGAWTRVGEALVSANPAAAASLTHELERATFARLPTSVREAYANPAFADVVSGSRVRLAHLRAVALWTDALREARNAVHHDVDAPLPATWDTTAALMVGAVPNLRRLWAVIHAAAQTTAP